MKLLKNIIYVIVGYLSIIAVGSIAQVLNQFVWTEAWAQVVAIIFMILLCRWLGKKIIEKGQNNE